MSKLIAFRAYYYLYWPSHIVEIQNILAEVVTPIYDLLATFISQEYGKWQTTLFYQMKWLSNSRYQKPILMKWKDALFRDIPQVDSLLLGCVFGIQMVVSATLEYRFPFVPKEQGHDESQSSMYASIAKLAHTLDSRRISTMSRAIYLAAKWDHK